MHREISATHTEPYVWLLEQFLTSFLFWHIARQNIFIGLRTLTCSTFSQHHHIKRDCFCRGLRAYQEG